MNERDLKMMAAALDEARRAAALDEVPVGAVVVRGDEIIARSCNLRETQKSALAHAELGAIAAACAELGGWRLHECELYVTLEPCPMCAGAAINARVRRIVYGASDPKAGCAGSIVDLFGKPFNHHPQVEGGVLERECGDILREFFRNKRKRAHKTQ